MMALLRDESGSILLEFPCNCGTHVFLMDFEQVGTIIVMDPITDGRRMMDMAPLFIFPPFDGTLGPLCAS